MAELPIDALLAALKAQGICDAAGVPCSFFTPLFNALCTDNDLAYVSATSEGEAVAIAAGLIAAGRPALALMQNSGLGNAVNPLTSLVHIYQIPLVLLCSHRGQPGVPDEPQHALMGQVTHELARLCGLRVHSLDGATFAATLAEAQAQGLAAAWICPHKTLTGNAVLDPAPIAITLRARKESKAEVHQAGHSREALLRAALPWLGGSAAPAVISTTGKLSRELYELDDREHQRVNRFYMVGSMGCAAGFALGVARGLSRRGLSRRVLILDGDGAVLMKLGTLATIGALAPESLHHVVFDNGVHDSTGGQPTSSAAIDLAEVARGCGYRDVATVSHEREFVSQLERQLSCSGPTFLRVLVRAGSRADLGRPKLAPRANWQRFVAFLKEAA